MSTTETLSDEADDRDLTPAPYLVLGLECARPDAGSMRLSLAGIDEVRIGRGRDRRASRVRRTLTIEVADTSLSIDHVRLVRAGAAWSISDPGSKNGTRVDGVRTAEGAVADRAVIEAGQTFFVLRALTGSADSGDLALDATADDLATFDPRLAADLATLARLAHADLPLLILGETGTGKESVARAAHARSGRRGPYVAVNCGAIAATLLESELFGHRRGAFSGASEDRAGLVRAADGGTLFLDEIAELTQGGQAALLRVIQEREVVPVGGTVPLAVDLRIASATCQNLGALVALGRFRRDLHARIAGATVRLPALRDRRDDLGLLVARILARRGDRAAAIDRLAARALFLHDWPENIRELDQRLAAALALGDGRIAAGAITAALATHRAEPSPPAPEVDRARLASLLERHRGNVSQVAAALGTSRSQVRRLAERFGLPPSDFRR